MKALIAVMLAFSTVILLTLPCARSAHAFAQADASLDAQIPWALQEAALQYGANPWIDGLAMERLLLAIAARSLGRSCFLAPRGYTMRDVICPPIIGPCRPISYQVKTGISPTTVVRICMALDARRYSGVRMALADDTYDAVLAKCGTTVAAYERASMIERIGITTSRIRLVGSTLAATGSDADALLASAGGTSTVATVSLGRRLLRSLPAIGWATGAGSIMWKTYGIVADASLNARQMAQNISGMVARETVTYGAAIGVGTIAVALVPTSPAWVPVILSGELCKLVLAQAAMICG